MNAGQNASFTVTASGTAPTSYQWRKDGVNANGATNAILTLNNVQTDQAGNYTVVITNAYGSVTSSVAVLTVNLVVGIPPVITIQPTNVTVSVTSNATFIVAATGTAPLSYQWRKDGVNASAATNATLTLNNVQTNQAGNYTVIITNAYGSVTSSVAVLTVNLVVGIGPTITTQPANVTVSVTSNATFIVAATGTAPLSYQWRKDGVNASGAINATLTLNNVQTNQAGNYTVVITNAYGSVTSSVAVLTVTVPLIGTVVAWGKNNYGQTNVPPGLSGVTAVAGGYEYTVALKNDGTVVAWGRNNLGQTNVPAGLKDVTAISASYTHTVALKSDGTVVAWGDTVGKIVTDGLSGVTAIAAGYYHTLALKSDGTVLAWGQIVPAGLSGVKAIAAGYLHSVALKSNGTVVAWGNNAFGQTNVPAGLSNATAIAANDTTVVLKSDGTVVAWGNYFSSGQTPVPADLSGVKAIAVGAGHTVALKIDGTVVVWGYNNFGGANVPAGLIGVTAVAGGGAHTVALVGTGFVGPKITIQLTGGNLVLTWPSASAQGFALHGNANVGLANPWATVGQSVVSNLDYYSVTLPITSTNQFFRLEKP